MHYDGDAQDHVLSVVGGGGRGRYASVLGQADAGASQRAKADIKLKV